VIDTAPRLALDQGQRQTLVDLAAMAMDRMEIRRVEAARRESGERFERVTETAVDAVVCADGEGRITSWNAAAEAIFGYRATEVIGRSLSVLVPERASTEAAPLRDLAAGRAEPWLGRTVELRARCRDGRELPVEVSLSMWSENGARGYGAIMRDISERKEAEAHLRYLAHHDPLTGLSNRTQLRKRLRRVAEDARRRGLSAALLMVDLDHFKDVNDALGHPAGDRLLRAVARRLGQCVRADDTVTRLGGDEFALLMPGIGDPNHAAALAEKVIAALGRPLGIDGQVVHLEASIGVTLCPDDGSGPDELMSNVDLALQQAKNEGRGGYRFFADSMREEVEVRRALERELRRAVAEDQFELHYQPQVKLADGRIAGVEALLRWHHPERGLLLPGQFLPVLESSRLAVQVGDWVLATACAQARAWLDRGLPPVRTGVNLSVAQFRSGDLASAVKRCLAASGLPPALLELEVTENTLLQNDAATRELVRLHQQGVSIAFDDFGTGYASLSYLKRFPLNRIKIDRSFVRDIGTDPDDAAIVRAVVGLGQTLGLEIIAEGIEDAQQEAFLRHLGCDEAQGFRYGRPLPADQTTALLSREAELTGDQRQAAPLSAG
jgi:diguanylate cyclase (GGDEF)-like protein/PAS domain S-box-containing protein